jgi:hypothetical protein
VGLALVGLAVACQPSATQPSAQPTQTDAFAVVRATADAAYRAGQADLDRGQLEQALVELDQAKTNDPDNRPEIQQAIDETIRRIQALPPATETAIVGGPGPGALVTPPPVAQTQVVRLAPTAVQAAAPQGQSTPATAQAAQAAAAGQTPGAGPTAGQAGAAPGPGGSTGQAGAAMGQTPSATTGQAGVAAGATAGPGATNAGAGAAATGVAGPGGLVTWRDAQGRFSIGAPSGWETLNAPQSLFGTGVVGFREPQGQAELDVAVDTSTRAVSPELYAASMELAMQQVPGYALDSVQPGTTAGNPSVRRVFSQTRQDARGQDYTARGFQLAIVRGSTAYVLSAFAPAQRYGDYSATFEGMVDSLAFG